MVACSRKVLSGVERGYFLMVETHRVRLFRQGFVSGVGIEFIIGSNPISGLGRYRLTGKANFDIVCSLKVFWFVLGVGKKFIRRSSVQVRPTPDMRV